MHTEHHRWCKFTWLFIIVRDRNPVKVRMQLLKLARFEQLYMYRPTLYHRMTMATAIPFIAIHSFIHSIYLYSASQETYSEALTTWNAFPFPQRVAILSGIFFSLFKNRFNYRGSDTGALDSPILNGHCCERPCVNKEVQYNIGRIISKKKIFSMNFVLLFIHIRSSIVIICRGCYLHCVQLSACICPARPCRCALVFALLSTLTLSV